MLGKVESNGDKGLLGKRGNVRSRLWGGGEGVVRTLLASQKAEAKQKNRGKGKLPDEMQKLEGGVLKETKTQLAVLHVDVQKCKSHKGPGGRTYSMLTGT